MAAISYTINADNYTTSVTKECLVTESVTINGYKAGTLSGYGINNGTTVLPGCSYTTKIVGNLYTMSGKASTMGTYTFPMQKVSSGKYTTGGTLTIVVKQNFYQNLFFNANGGSGAPSTQSWSTQATSQPSATTRTISATVPTRDNYYFQGWSTSSSASTASYSPGGSISLSWSTSSTAGTTLYAVWWGNWKAILTYDGNGGSGVPADQINTTIQYNKPSSHGFIIPDTIPTREGFVFLGWSEEQLATVPDYEAGDMVQVEYAVTESPKTLFAVWQEIPTPSAKMKVNVGGSWVDASVSVKVNGSWVTPDKVYGKVNGSWKEGT